VEQVLLLRLAETTIFLPKALAVLFYNLLRFSLIMKSDRAFYLFSFTERHLETLRRFQS